MKKRIFSLLMAVCALMGTAWAQLYPAPSETSVANVWKYQFNIKGWAPADNLSSQGRAVDRTEYDFNATVWGNYKFEINLPTANARTKMALDTIYSEALMQLVPSLGVQSRAVQRPIRTAIESNGKNVTISSALSNFYNFMGATVPVTVEDAKDTAKFDYTIAHINNYQIVGTASAYCVDNVGFSGHAARNAWYLLCSKVNSLRQSPDDSYMIFKKGAYIKIGNEKLVFMKDCKVASGQGSLKEIKALLNDATATKIKSDSEDARMQYMFLPAGSTLAFGGSYATLKENMLMTIDGTNYNVQGTELNNWITDFKTQLSSENEDEYQYNAITKVINRINQVVGMVDDANNVPVTLDFFGIGTGYNEDEKGGKTIQTPEEYTTMQDTAKNAVVVAPKFFEYTMDGLNNVILKTTTEATGTTYTCDNFILTDPNNTGITELCDYYSPVDFVAANGSYTRKLFAGYNTCCVPFALKYKNLVDENGDAFAAADVKILSFESFNGSIANFTELGHTDNDSIKASIPCLIWCQNDGNLYKEFKGDSIKGKEAGTTDNFEGTYVRETKWNGKLNYYSVTSDHQELAKAAAKVYPFRSVITMTATAGAPARMSICVLGAKGNPTALDEVGVNADGSIYSLDGRKLDKVPAAGLYIKNGKVQFAK